MQSTSRVDQKLEKNTSELLKREGLITPNEQFETIYLADDEIEQFMDKYLRENPGTEVETRYISHPPIELTQNIEVRWLRPETPEIPPIIIKEVEDPNAPRAPTPPPLRIVQKSRPQQQPEEPIVIREKPPMMTIAEPKFAYVQNVVKRQVSKSGTANTGNSNNSQSTFSRAGVGAAVVGRSRLDYEEQRSERDAMNYSYEEHGGSIVDYDEVVEEYEEVVRTSGSQSRGGGAGEHDEHMMMMSETATHTAATTAVTAPAHSGVGQTPRAGRHLHLQRTYEDEHQLRIYEEKLKKTLYEEYLLRLERERLERKLSRSGLLEERIRERSISQDRLSTHQQLMDDAKYRAIFTHIPGHNEMRHHIIRERNTQSLEKDQANTIATSQPSVSTQQQQQQQQQNPYLQLPPPLPQTSQPAQQQQQQHQQQPQKFYLQSQSHTSSYKNIKFTRVTDETDLERLNSILDNPKSPVLDSRGQVAETIAKSLGTGDLERRLAGLTDPPTNVVVPVHDVSEIINTPAPSKPVVIRIRPIQTNNTTQPNRTDKQNNNNNINNNNNNNNNNSEPNEQYFAIISSKITNKNISSQTQKQQQPQQQPLRQFDRIYAADGIANINDLATDKRSNYTNQGLSTNNLIKDISATSSATKGVAIDSDPYYQRRYPKQQQQQQQPQQINEPKLISYEEQLRIESNIKSFFPHLNYPIINVK